MGHPLKPNHIGSHYRSLRTTLFFFYFNFIAYYIFNRFIPLSYHLNLTYRKGKTIHNSYLFRVISYLSNIGDILIIQESSFNIKIFALIDSTRALEFP